MKLEKSLVILTLFALSMIIIAGLLVIYVQKQDAIKRDSQVSPIQTVEPTIDPSTLHVANVASKYCTDNGGELKIEKNSKGFEYGVCAFPPKDGVEGFCEEWAFYKGKCPSGGFRIQSQVTAETRFCVISGGEFQDGGIDDQGNLKGKCYFYPVTQCDMYEFYKEECVPVEIQYPGRVF